MNTSNIRDFVIIIAVIFFSYNYFNNETIIETKEVIKEVKDSIKKTQPRKVKFVKRTKPIKKIKKDSIKEFTYIDSLANGVLTSRIVADNIYKRDVSLKTYSKETTKTIVKNTIFLEVGSSVSINRNVRDINVGLLFVKGNKWSVGINVGYDIIYKQSYYGFKIGIPIN